MRNGLDVREFLLGAGTPVLMLAMGALNYIRDGASVKGTSISGLLLDFLYKQSTSFGALSKGIPLSLSAANEGV